MHACMHKHIQTYVHTYILSYFLPYLPTEYLHANKETVFVCFLTYLLTYLPTCLLTYLTIYLLTDWLTYLPACLPAYLPTYVPTYLPRYVHTWIHGYMDTWTHTKKYKNHLFCTAISHTNKQTMFAYACVRIYKHRRIQKCRSFISYIRDNANTCTCTVHLYEHGKLWINQSKSDTFHPFCMGTFHWGIHQATLCGLFWTSDIHGYLDSKGCLNF